MFHLVDRIYLYTDAAIDLDQDRVVISKENGNQVHEVFEKLSKGTMFYVGHTVEEVIGDEPIKFFSDLIKISRNRNRELFIYADKKALPAIMAIWFRILFAKPSPELCKKIYSSTIFKINFLSKSFIVKRAVNLNHQSDYVDSILDEYLKKPLKITTNNRKRFILENVGYLSVDYLLFTYLYQGKFKKELKQSIRTLVKRNIDKILLELKTLFIIYRTNEVFCKKLGIEQITIDNLNVENKGDRYSEFFFSNRLYRNKDITKPSSSKNFNFQDMTDTDYETLLNVYEVMGKHYNPDQGVNFFMNEEYKMKFIKILYSDFTDEMLDEIIETEANFNNPDGIFYDALHETVNNFFVQFILQKYKQNDLKSIEGLSLL